MESTTLQQTQTTFALPRAWRGNDYNFRVLLHLNGLGSIVLSIFSSYLILFKSTASIKTYKWYLLYITLSCFLFEVFFGVFYAPDFMYPMTGICANGPDAKKLSSPLQSLIPPIATGILLSIMLFSTVVAFVYRLAAITGSTEELHSWKTFLIAIFIYALLLIPIILSFCYAALVPREEVWENLKINIPLAYEYSLIRSCFYISKDLTPISFIILQIFILTGLLICPLTCLVLIFIIVHKLRFYSPNLTQQTYRMQKQLFISLILQFTLPAIFIVLPLFLLLFLQFFGILNYELSYHLGYFLMHMLSAHSNLNALAMIATVKPYRAVIINAFYSVSFCCKRGLTQYRKQSKEPTVTSQLFERRQAIVE